MSAGEQLALSFDGSVHCCAGPLYAKQGCGREWQCDEAQCRLGTDSLCPKCSNYVSAHSRAACNRQKREPEIDRMVQRTAAIHAGMPYEELCRRFDRPDWKDQIEDLRVREFPGGAE